MVSSKWKCPKCKAELFLTNSGRYWCTVCQHEQPAEKVDPCNRDYTRMKVLVDMTVERVLAGGEL